MPFTVRDLTVCILGLGMSTWSGISSDQGSNASRTGYLLVYCVFPPIWETTFSMRLCSSFFPSSSDSNAEVVTIPSEYRYEGRFQTLPWGNISREAIALELNCQNGYQDVTLSEQIQDGYLRNYTQLYNIYIVHCEVSTITEDTFLNMPKLREIDFEYNRLKFLHPKAFWSLTDLNWVRLLHNELTVISAEYICNNPKISHIQLHYNNITEIRVVDSATCSFNNVNGIGMEGNPIDAINSSVFQQFRINGVISLSACGIHSLSMQTFQGIKDTLGVDLSLNHLTETPEYLFQPMSRSLQLIDLSSNRFEMINTTFMFGGVMELLEIRLHNNTIQTIHGSFSDYRNLRNLFLGFNKLTDIQPILFQNSASLQQLDLKHNRIDVIDRDSFRNCVRMRHFDISGNRLKILPLMVIGYLPNLVSFNISFNQLESIPTNMFTHNTNIMTVDISGNSVSSLELILPDSLKVLNLSMNYLKGLSLVTAGGSTNCSLSDLNVSHNMLESVDLGKASRSLKTLDLSHNYIKDINVLSGLYDMINLKIRSNRIQSVCLPFEVRDSLEILDLGNNRIASLCKGTFSHPIKLRDLLLDHNQLKYVDGDMLEDASNLKRLTLAYNPLQCNCRLADLQQFLTINSHVTLDNITCSGGSLLKGFDFAYCKHSNLLAIVITSSVSLCLILLVAGVVTVFRYEIQVIAFYKWNIRLTFCKKTQKIASFKYDVFVCFAEEQICFVKNTLLPILEPKYRTCVYYRDFFVGDNIADAIIDVINNSAVTVILLSKAFLDSRWGQFEFKHAHYQSMVVENQKLVLVVMDDVVLKTKLPDLTLRSILYAKVYLTKDDRLFKEKLMFAMHGIQGTGGQERDQRYSDNSEMQPLL